MLIDQNFGPTEPISGVEFYFDKSEITQEYIIFGRALATNIWFPPGSNKGIINKLAAVALEKGANAVLITDVQKSDQASFRGSSMSENHVSATFLAYR